jgi:AcrR family transcriptional regulator
MTSATSRADGTRAYNSARRAQQAAQTRLDVIDAAIALFGSAGWAGATVAAIAERAGVAVETVYKGVGSKKHLLRVAMDAAVVGDADPVPLVERAEFRSLSEGSWDERVAKGAAINARIQERSAGVWQAVREAAGSDEEVDAWRLEMEHGRRTDIGRAAAAIFGRAPDDQLVTLLWIVYGPDAYLQLVRDQGYDAAAYEAFLIDATKRLAATA